MKYDALTLQRAQRHAYDLLSTEYVMSREGVKGAFLNKAGQWVVANPYYVHPEFITAPVELVQEQAYTNNKESFTFDYSLNAPAKSVLLNNVNLAQNDIVAIYGLKLWQGQGANANNRVYRSRGLTVNDNSVYNSTVSMKLESSTLIDQVPGQNFKDEEDINNMCNEYGMVLIQPIRIFTGRLGKFTVTYSLNNPINGLVLTAEMFLSSRLVCVLGQAAGVNLGRK